MAVARDGDVERAPDPREQQPEAVEQPVHQPRLLQEIAHEEEQRHGGEQGLAHYLKGVQDHQIEHRGAEPDDAEDDPEEDQRERNRKTDADAR